MGRAHGHWLVGEGETEKTDFFFLKLSWINLELGSIWEGLYSSRSRKEH